MKQIKLLIKKMYCRSCQKVSLLTCQNYYLIKLLYLLHQHSSFHQYLNIPCSRYWDQLLYKPKHPKHLPSYNLHSSLLNWNFISIKSANETILILSNPNIENGIHSTIIIPYFNDTYIKIFDRNIHKHTIPWSTYNSLYNPGR